MPDWSRLSEETYRVWHRQQELREMPRWNDRYDLLEAKMRDENKAWRHYALKTVTKSERRDPIEDAEELDRYTQKPYVVTKHLTSCDCFDCYMGRGGKLPRDPGVSQFSAYMKTEQILKQAQADKAKRRKDLEEQKKLAQLAQLASKPVAYFQEMPTIQGPYFHEGKQVSATEYMNGITKIVPSKPIQKSETCVDCQKVIYFVEGTEPVHYPCRERLVLCELCGHDTTLGKQIGYTPPGREFSITICPRCHKDLVGRDLSKPETQRFILFRLGWYWSFVWIIFLLNCIRFILEMAS